MGARILGIGSHVPERTLSNADIERLVDTSDEWIVQRTGIRTRHILDDAELPSDMSVVAGRRAIEAAGLAPDDIDLLLISTTFPDMICPGSAPFIAEGLGLGNAPFFDLKAGCTGFVYGLGVGDALVRAGLCKHPLVIGAEALSRVVDWTDRSTCILFGDGAGAVVLGPGEPDTGVLGTALYGDAEKALLLHLLAGGTRTPASHETVERREHYIRMEGSGVFRNAAPMMERATLDALDAAGLELGDVDWIIPHQANVRIIDALVRRLDVAPERVVTNLDRVANTSAASIPIALDEAVRAGTIRPGHVIVVTGFGAGVTYGAVIVRI
jgi:3-oxoacyl-[acyl-carrier-protein] synthase-3